MGAALTGFLAIIQALIPSISSSVVVQQVLNGLIQIIPVLVKEAQDLVPMVKNIIAALSANPASTADQLATLKALDQLTDSAFEAAAAKALAEDAAAAATPPAA
jgi:hypothetical protein